MGRRGEVSVEGAKSRLEGETGGRRKAWVRRRVGNDSIGAVDLRVTPSAYAIVAAREHYTDATHAEQHENVAHTFRIVNKGGIAATILLLIPEADVFVPKPASMSNVIPM